MTAGRFQGLRRAAAPGVGFILLAAATLAACEEGDRWPATQERTPLSVKGGDEPTPPVPIEMPGEVNDGGTARLGDAERLGVELHDFFFAPTYVEFAPAASGRTIVVTLDNAGSEEHTFTLDDAAVDEVLSPGEKRQIELTIANPQQRMIYYCRYHRDRGMQGALFPAGPSL